MAHLGRSDLRKPSNALNKGSNTFGPPPPQLLLCLERPVQCSDQLPEDIISTSFKGAGSGDLLQGDGAAVGAEKIKNKTDMDIQERRMAVTIVESILDRVMVNPDQKNHIKSFIKKYKLTEDVLGQGCTSIVKRAISRETGKSVAVKIIDITNRVSHNLKFFCTLDR